MIEIDPPDEASQSQLVCAADSTCDRTPRAFQAAWKAELIAFGARRIYERSLPDTLYEAVLLKALQGVVPIQSLRCPFYIVQDISLVPRGLIPRGTELCEHNAVSDQQLREYENANK